MDGTWMVKGHPTHGIQHKLGRNGLRQRNVRWTIFCVIVFGIQKKKPQTLFPGNLGGEEEIGEDKWITYYDKLLKYTGLENCEELQEAMRDREGMDRDCDQVVWRLTTTALSSCVKVDNDCYQVV